MRQCTIFFTCNIEKPKSKIIIFLVSLSTCRNALGVRVVYGCFGIYGISARTTAYLSLQNMLHNIFRAIKLNLSDTMMQKVFRKFSVLHVYGEARRDQCTTRRNEKQFNRKLYIETKWR